MKRGFRWAIAILALPLGFSSCEEKPRSSPQKQTIQHVGDRYTCSVPTEWKLTEKWRKEKFELVELEISNTAFFFINAHDPGSEVSLEDYCNLRCDKFPEVHERDYPSHTVEPQYVGRKETSGPHDGLKSSYKVSTPAGPRQLNYRFFLLTSPQYHAFIEIYDEGDLTATHETQITAILDSIKPKQNAEQVADDQLPARVESKAK